MKINIYDYLLSLAERTLDKCLFTVNTQYCTRISNVLVPSGDGFYPSFWVRDCVMMAESGLLDDKLMKEYIEIFATHGQNGGKQIELENGLCIPPYACADHINYDGGTVFFPGIYSDSTNQGTGRFGFYPPYDDNFYFILLVFFYIKKTGDVDILEKRYNDMSLLDHIEKAFLCYGIDDATQLVYSNSEKYTVDWGFCDTIKKTGFLLMPSILRANAAIALSEMFKGDSVKKQFYDAVYNTIKVNILMHFYDYHTGWLYSATEIGKQHDVWVTAYAIYSHILPEDLEIKTAKVLKDSYLDGSATKCGSIRHILLNENFSNTTAWEDAHGREINIYQNGAYWATPTGWYFYALYKHYPETALKLMKDFIEDVEKGKTNGAPYEWFSPEKDKMAGKYYGTSGVLPYTAVKKLGLKNLTICI